MKPEDLHEQVAIELELMEATIRELLALQRDVAGREPMRFKSRLMDYLQTLESQ